jgi:hypothetical protein
MSSCCKSPRQTYTEASHRSTDFLSVVSTIGRSWTARVGPPRASRRSRAAGPSEKAFSGDDGDEGHSPPASPSGIRSCPSTPELASPSPIFPPSCPPPHRPMAGSSGWGGPARDPSSEREEGVGRAKNAGELVEQGLEDVWAEGRGLGTVGRVWEQAMWGAELE